MTATLTPPSADPTGSPPRITPGRVALTALVLLIAVSALVVTSLALFTDSATVTSNTFSTGRVDINATRADAAVSISAMAPGDQDTTEITVANSGSLDLRYAIESTTTEDVLAAQLVLTLKSNVSQCDDANWDATGTTLYSGRLGSMATDAIVGSAAAGDDTDDRTLAPTASEILCVNVTLPLATTTGEGLTTTATLSFEAEQVRNNP